MPSLDDVAAELYALPPEDFTAARDAASKGLDKDLATAVKRLRRPTAAAWLVNRLVRESPELLEPLLELGPALAAAQSAGSGDELRTLSRQRRELVQAVTAAAVDGAGREVAAAVRTEVEQTLDAALADPAAADAVRTGALVRALSFAGFGGVDVDGAVAVTGRRRKPAAPGATAPPATEADERRPGRPAATTSSKTRRTAAAEQRALDAAAALDDAVRVCEATQRRADDADAALAGSEQERGAVQAEVDDLEQRLAAARERLAEAGHRAHDAQGAADKASQARDRAQRRVAQAQEEAEAARAALDALRRG